MHKRQEALFYYKILVKTVKPEYIFPQNQFIERSGKNRHRFSPGSIAEMGVSVGEIFAGYYDVQAKVGSDHMHEIPYGAIGDWTLADKLAGGLQQFMAGARKFSPSENSREDIWACNREIAAETDIGFITEVQDESAKKILKS